MCSRNEPPMEYGGGSIIRNLVGGVIAEIRDYYGRQNEIKAGAASKPLPKPGAIFAVEYCEKFRTTLVSGGLMEQPYLWMLELEAAMAEISLQEHLSSLGGWSK